MPTSTVVFDGAEYQIVETASAPEKDPAAAGGWTSRTLIWKAGSTGANKATLETRAAAALATNATYLALTTPSAAQNTAQAKALTRQVNALIKLLLNDLADVNGT